MVMNMDDNGCDKEPDWMNPANDRKTPYTDEEIDTFVENFIRGLDEHEWLSMMLLLPLDCISPACSEGVLSPVSP